MLIHPWDAATGNTEWGRWLRQGHDFGQLVANGPRGQPHVVPTRRLDERATDRDKNAAAQQRRRLAETGQWRVPGHD